MPGAFVFWGTVIALGVLIIVDARQEWAAGRKITAVVHTCIGAAIILGVFLIFRPEFDLLWAFR